MQPLRSSQNSAFSNVIQILGLINDQVRLEQIECNHCVHLKILHSQM